MENTFDRKPNHETGASPVEQIQENNVLYDQTPDDFLSEIKSSLDSTEGYYLGQLGGYVSPGFRDFFQEYPKAQDKAITFLYAFLKEHDGMSLPLLEGFLNEIGASEDDLEIEDADYYKLALIIVKQVLQQRLDAIKGDEKGISEDIITFAAPPALHEFLLNPEDTDRLNFSGEVLVLQGKPHPEREAIFDGLFDPDLFLSADPLESVAVLTENRILEPDGTRIELTHAPYYFVNVDQDFLRNPKIEDQGRLDETFGWITDFYKTQKTKLTSLDEEIKTEYVPDRHRFAETDNNQFRDLDIVEKLPIHLQSQFNVLDGKEMDIEVSEPYGDFDEFSGPIGLAQVKIGGITHLDEKNQILDAAAQYLSDQHHDGTKFQTPTVVVVYNEFHVGYRYVLFAKKGTVEPQIFTSASDLLEGLRAEKE